MTYHTRKGGIKQSREIFGNMITKNFLKIMKDSKPQIKETQKIPKKDAH